MIRLDEDALICDLAETYHILNYKALPPELVGVLSIGLRNDSRIKMKMGNQDIDMSSQLMAAMVDRLSLLIWQNTKDGYEGINKPPSILESLTTRKKITQAPKFSSIEEFKDKYSGKRD